WHFVRRRMRGELGAGWQANEHRHYGLRYGTVAERADRLDEAAVVIRSLLDRERSDHRGSHYRLDSAPMMPKPIQGRLPLMIGGKGPRRTWPLVGRVADEWNGWVTPTEMVELGRIIDRHAEGAGRDPADIGRSAALLVFLCEDEDEAARIEAVEMGRSRLVGTPAQLVEGVAAYAEAGADELVIADFNWPADRAHEIIETLATEVFSAFDRS
ncbi:MAG: LLM class flavin-dependent oxidoreductase, partial [Acidimicrobiales bacterium]